MRRHLAVLLPATLSVIVACGGDEESAAPEAETRAPAAETPESTAVEKVTFKLEPEHRSGVSGTATLRGGDAGFTVIVAVKRPGDAAPVHIHDVTCEEYRALKDFDAQLATVEVPLPDLVNGKGRSREDAALSQYRTGGFSLNVHSTEGGFPVVACGDLPPE